MMSDLDTFLVALYSMADDLCQKHYAPHTRRRRGHRHRLFGAEAAIGRGGCDRERKSAGACSPTETCDANCCRNR